MATLWRNNLGTESSGLALLDGSERQERGGGAGFWTGRTVAGVMAIALVVWLGLIFSVDEIRFVIIAPEAKAGFEVFLALLRLFAALALFLFPAATERPRLHWVALGFLILGVGGLGFGYLYPAVVDTVDLNTTMYGSIVARSAATLVIAVGLVSPRLPSFSWRVVFLALFLYGLLSVAVGVAGDRLPALVMVDDLQVIAATSFQTLPGLTPWHWGLSLLPLLFAVAAAFGAVWHFPGRVLGGWLAMAMVMMAGSQLHTLFWPSAYSPVLTTSSLLRLTFTAVVAIGGFLELRQVATERGAALAAERLYVKRLQELAALRADFTVIVAHELDNPLAAIRQAAELLAMGPLDAGQMRALTAITTETAALTTLVADVRMAAETEQDDFAVRLHPVPVADLLADASAYATGLPNNHVVAIEGAGLVSVWADSERIGQVLRNLLKNAATYAPPGAPITLRAMQSDNHVRIAVIDRGDGINPDDVVRIFEKFGRGRTPPGRNSAGAGLGLYVSRCIVRAHGGELTVESTPGVGSVFAFALEVAP